MSKKSITFARAYFYMVTCYGRDLNGNYPDLPIYGKKKTVGWRLDNKDVGSRFAMQNDNYLEFQPWEQAVLNAWHRADPVSVKEINRADAVSDFQHNRNPFIDYPYLAEYIWGEKAHETLDMANLMASSDPEFIPGKSNGWRDSQPSDIDQASNDQSPITSKVIKNGQIFILRGDRTYTLTGLEVR